MKFTIVIRKLIFVMILTSFCFGVRVYEGVPLPNGRGGHCAGVVDNKIIVVGGSYWSEDKSRKIFLKDSLIFEGGGWKPGPAIPLELYCSMYDYDKSGLYIVGGRNYDKLSSGFFCIKSVKGQMAVDKLPDFPKGITDGTAAILKSKLYVCCPTDSNGLTNSMWLFDLKNPDQGWTLCPSLPGQARAFPGVVQCGRRLILLGGIVLSGFEVLRDAYVYDSKENTWERLPDMPTRCYGFGARAVDNNKILMTGIGDEKIHDSIWLLDIGDMSIRNIGQTIIPTLSSCLIQPSSNTFWLIGGEPDANKNRSNKITIIETGN